MRRAILVLFFGIAAALSACGGDDSKNDSTTNPAQVTTSPDDSSNSSSAAAEENGKKSNGRRAKSRARSESRKESRRKRARSRSERRTSRREQLRRQKALSAPGFKAPKPGSKPKEGQLAPPPTPKGAEPELPKTDAATFRAAKAVCGGLYETALRGKTKDEVARDYARPWPKDRQDAAYKGCLEGLQLPRPPEDDEADY